MIADTSGDTSLQDVKGLQRLTFSIAYRMLGSVADAEDIVQESFLRLHRAETEGTPIESPKSYLATIATRLAIDHLRSARVRREQYVGSWLPEPLVGEREPDGARRVEVSESVSMAFFLLLETLSPIERAVFLLREVFDYGYGEIASIVEKSEENCRQIFVRAKRRIDSGKPRFEGSSEKRDELARRFFAASEAGDMAALVDLLAADAVFYRDGGGKGTGILHPVRGRDHVARLIDGIFLKGRALGVRLQPALVNGQPGAIATDSERRVISVFALDIADGAVQAIRTVINPDKLQHLGPVSDLGRLPGSR